MLEGDIERGRAVPEPRSRDVMHRYAKRIAPGAVFSAAMLALLLTGDYAGHWHLGWKAWATIAITLLALSAMLGEFLSAGWAMLAALGAFVVIAPKNPILSDADALAGFASDSIATIAVMFGVAEGLRLTGAIETLLGPVLGRPRSLVVATARLCLPTAAVSAFTNNTPLVAMLTPMVQKWARSVGHSTSKLLLPMNFAIVLGGTITILGTSTNLVVQTYAKQKGLSLNVIELALAGVPNALAGILYLMLASPLLVPDRQSINDRVQSNPREYVIAAQIGPPIHGRSIDEARLRHLEGVFLFEVRRPNGDVVAAPDAATRLFNGDTVLFAGCIDGVRDVFSLPGLVPTELEQAMQVRGTRRRLFEAVVASQAPIVGRSVRESQFRVRHNAAVIAVHRSGDRLRGKIGDIELQSADTLLLEAAPSFPGESQADFALVVEVGDGVAPVAKPPLPMILSVVLVVAAIALAATNVLPLFGAVLACLFAMLLTRCVTIADVWRAQHVDVLLASAASLAIGAAVSGTGIAGGISKSMIAMSHHLGHLGSLFLFYVITSGLATIISNKAAVGVLFPVGWDLVTGGLFAPKEMVYVLMLAASADWANPYSYLTNLITYAAGGFRPLDFARVGAGLHVVTCVVSVLACWGIWGQ